MKNANAAIVYVALMLSAATMNAQGKDSLLSYYDTQTIRISYQSFGGLVLNYQGETYTIAMGLSANMRDVLSGYQDTKQLLDGYTGANLAGNILIFGGLGLTVGAAAVPLVTIATTTGNMQYTLASRTAALTTAYTIGAVAGGIGLLCEIIGAFILPSSFQQLTQSVNIYNRHKIEEYQK
jgi:hypothetical protein